MQLHAYHVLYISVPSTFIMKRWCPSQDHCVIFNLPLATAEEILQANEDFDLWFVLTKTVNTKTIYLADGYEWTICISSAVIISSSTLQ